MTQKKYKIDSYLAAIFLIPIAMTLGCSDDDPQATAEPPEQFAFVSDGGDTSGDCASPDGCDNPAPRTMCSVVRHGEVMAFVEINDRVDHEYECDDRPFRFNHAVSDITVTEIVAGNSDFASVTEMYSSVSTGFEAGGTYILRADELNGKWWFSGSMEIEPDTMETTDSTGVYQNLPTNLGDFVDQASDTWYNYDDMCDTDIPRETDEDQLYDYVYGEDPVCSGETGFNPNNSSDDDYPDYPSGNNSEEPDGVGLNNSDDG